MRVCCLAKVTGKVQGVYFRASTQEQAIDLAISGYVKNLSDGSVEVLACGDRDNVEKLTAWLETGSEYSQVENVEVKEVEWQDFNHFSIG